MNLIILEDLKGFKKVINVAIFPLTYHMVEFPPLSVSAYDVGHDNALPKKLTFYPKGEPKQEYGVNILLYKQL